MFGDVNAVTDAHNAGIEAYQRYAEQERSCDKKS